MKNRVLGLVGSIVAALLCFAVPAFAVPPTTSNVMVVPEGGAAWMYLLLAGAPCFGAVFFHSRNKRAKR
jgi:hypothetical protein